MSTMRPIDPSPYSKGLPQLPDVKSQAKPQLRWLKIAELVIDSTYQRTIGPAGARNLRKIAIDFDWAKFGTVIVAPVARGKFAIIDGQHRTTAAALCGIKDVPCQIGAAPYERQAAAFAAINAQVTAMSPMQLHTARLAAREPQAVLLDEVCRAAGVTICRYPAPLAKLKVGETLAAGQLRNYLGRYGKDVLRSALRCITKTRDGNAGLVRAPIVAALCSVFDAEPEFCASEKRMLAAMEKFDFAKRYDKAAADARASRHGMTELLVDAIAAHLDKHIGGGA